MVGLKIIELSICYTLYPPDRSYFIPYGIAFALLGIEPWIDGRAFDPNGLIA